MKRLKIPRLFNAKKLSAATARRASAASAGMDFEGIPEPNMKLSRALLIVLLLHVVAVSGIIAFNAIKTRERAFVPQTSAQTENKPADAAQTARKRSPARTEDFSLACKRGTSEAGLIVRKNLHCEERR
jgi:hypothetical protein